jgi:hypothetical protein
MIVLRCRSERRQDSADHDDVPQTPWIWNPPGLVSHRDEDEPIAADLQQLQIARRRSHDGLSQSTQRDIYRTTSSRRESSERQRDSPSTNSENSHAADAPPLGRPSDPSSLYHRLGQQDGYAQHAEKARQPQSHLGHRNGGHDRHPHESHHRHHSHLGNGRADLEESFTSRLSLKPTFSPKIVRTPDHYQSPPSSRRSSQEEMSSHRSPNRIDPNRASPSRPDFYTPPSSASYSSSRANPSPTAPVSRNYSMPAPSSASASSSSFGLSQFVDEPSEAASAALSPLIGATPRPSRPVLRSQTEPLISPNGLGTITESERYTSRDYPRPSPLGPSPSTRDKRPSSHSPLQHNPLPAPPRDIHNPVTSAPLPRSPTPPTGTWSRRVRKGFWNKRGDFLTRDGYIVYAPPDRIYPPELRAYPKVEHGFRNETGDELPFFADRPELPESLPSRGQPPLQPYDLVSHSNFLCQCHYQLIGFE